MKAIFPSASAYKRSVSLGERAEREEKWTERDAAPGKETKSRKSCVWEYGCEVSTNFLSPFLWVDALSFSERTTQ